MTTVVVGLGAARSGRNEAETSSFCEGRVAFAGCLLKMPLPNVSFRIAVDISGERHEVLAYVSGKMRRHHIRILPGDTVTVEISPYDQTRGRITYRR